MRCLLSGMPVFTMSQPGHGLDKGGAADLWLHVACRAGVWSLPVVVEEQVCTFGLYHALCPAYDSVVGDEIFQLLAESGINGLIVGKQDCIADEYPFEIGHGF